LSVATVRPAVRRPGGLPDRLGVCHDRRARPVSLTPAHLGAAWWAGWAPLALVLAFPRYLYPLPWGAVWLVTEPLLYRLDPEHSLLGDVARGAWGRFARLWPRGLVPGPCGDRLTRLAGDRGVSTV